MRDRSLQPGNAVEVRMSKWGDRPHWEFAARWLGADDHGDWLGIDAGTTMTRPGATYVAPVPQLILSPAPGLPAAERGWVATFHAPGGPLFVYVDVTGPPTWSGRTLHAVDLDLDVLRDPDGAVRIDDEDEFAEHQSLFGYPPEVIEGALGSCARLHRLVAAGHPPYDETPAAWFERLAGLG